MKKMTKTRAARRSVYDITPVGDGTPGSAQRAIDALDRRPAGRSAIRGKPKKLLFMQLKCPAPWWPREKSAKGKKGAPAWVGVLAGGCGWTIGQGDPMTVEDIKDAKETVRMDYPEATFEIRRLP